MSIFTAKYGSHNRIVQWLMLAFVVSLGMGAEASIGKIKFSYITLFAVVIGLFIECIPSIETDIRSFFKKSFVKFSVVWVVYGALQRFWVWDTSLWQTYYKSLIINLVIISLLLFYIRTLEDWKWVSISLFVELVMYLAIGAWEIITAHHIVHGENVVRLTERTPLIFWVNENDAGVMFSMLLINCLILYFLEKRKMKEKIAFAIMLVVTLIEIYFTNGRGSIIGLLLLLVFGIYFYWLEGIEANDKRKGSLIIGGCVIGVAIIICIMLIVHPLTWYIKLFTSGNIYNMESDLFRLGLIIDSFDAFVKSHLLGIGPGQLVVVNGMPIHFFYLEILFEHGIIVGGYLLYLFIRVVLNYQSGISRLSGSIVRATPIALIMLGLSTSKMFLMRPTWVLFVLIYTIAEVAKE